MTMVLSKRDPTRPVRVGPRCARLRMSKRREGPSRTSFVRSVAGKGRLEKSSTPSSLTFPSARIDRSHGRERSVRRPRAGLLMVTEPALRGTAFGVTAARGGEVRAQSGLASPRAKSSRSSSPMSPALGGLPVTMALATLNSAISRG
jgi:hypothetical protein